MKVIYKYSVSIMGDIALMLPDGAEVLHVAEQPSKGGQMWVLHAIDRPLVTRYFRVQGTGHPIVDDDKLKYVATWQTQTGFVWHLFEVVR